MGPSVKVGSISNLVLVVVFAALTFAIVACSSPEPTATPVPLTPTPVPPTPTPIPPTATPETPKQPAAEHQGPIDEISPFGMEARDAVCVEAYADKETSAKIFEAIEKFNSGEGVEDQHVIDLFAETEVLARCSAVRERFMPILSMFSLEEAECIVEHAGVELIGDFVAFTEEHQTRVLDLEDLAPFLGSLQACEVDIDLTLGQ